MCSCSIPFSSMVQIKTQDTSIKRWFDESLARLISEKIITVYPEFNHTLYTQTITQKCPPLSLTQRIELHADTLFLLLPHPYPNAINILIKILGDENPNQTGMFSHFYWIMPIGKIVEKYGLNYFDVSFHALEEITKRNTSEYAIRPFITAYPQKTLSILKQWALSPNFHLRRLASEGLRPKLPWAKKLDSFIDKPAPVFEILHLLMHDEILFVKKSVANHLTDYLKVNHHAASQFIDQYKEDTNPHTQWILRRATRVIKPKQIPLRIDK